ncbi:MAG: hypothetical protein DKM50_09570 [Candidatus Margulisiibacteriota bacterium]|nr:MAG: hypothetical protein A2X41_07255 [Candidatus Margulisbacteria bacterium GWE2_39_32]PZM79017.1 MAG: hypothetical protein DKM50_09570 [Candidatus Margulisiibacteriota bacterium]HCT85283.1 hypothetical protein [Candidatus Margulisiibacteriota bacterium]HCY36108.1 hypothetical protein [Candidatus Margulisiibacteriota bacterium]
MKNIKEAITMANSLLPKGVIYPAELLMKHDLTKNPDREYLSYLVNGGAGGGYHHWLTLLLKHSEAKTIVELGNRYGSSTIALYHGLKPDQVLYSLDIVKDQRFVPEVIYSDQRVKFVIGDALDLNSYLDNNIDIPIDIDIFWTDTEHFYEQVAAEFDVYEPLFSDEAIIVMDDINMNDTRQLFDAMPFEKYDLTSICHGSGFGVIHYVRDEKERGKSRLERINQSLLNSSKIIYGKYQRNLIELERNKKVLANYLLMN